MKNNWKLRRQITKTSFFLFSFFVSLGTSCGPEARVRWKSMEKRMSLLCEVEKTLEDVKSAFIQEIKHLSYLRQRKNKAMEVYHARETIWKIDLDNRSYLYSFLEIIYYRFASFERIFHWNFVKSYSVTFDKKKNFQEFLELTDLHIFKIATNFLNERLIFKFSKFSPLQWILKWIFQEKYNSNIKSIKIMLD